MKRTDIKVGMTVYHSIYVHWGPGVVKEITYRNFVENLFEKGSTIRVVVEFDGLEEIVRVIPSLLRKTPNKKKIREMVAMYNKRGTAAIDGGDRLIISND